MIIQCQSCAAKYFLPEAKVPAEPTRVKCPKCVAVFTLEPRHEHVAAAPSHASVEPAMSVESPVAEAAPVAETPPATEMPPLASAPAAAEVADSAPAAKPAKKGPRPKRGSKEDRARRLARVLVSDILCYNQDKRDQALKDGSLMTVLGEEIKKSWELYKDKVGDELASSTNYFKEALNEILADGQEVF